MQIDIKLIDIGHAIDEQMFYSIKEAIKYLKRLEKKLEKEGFEDEI